MKTVIYKGQDCHLGKHGQVKAGAVIELTEREWQFVQANSPEDFEVKQEKSVPVGNQRGGKKAEGAKDEGKGEDSGNDGLVVLANAPSHNLTEIDWNRPDLIEFLNRTDRKVLTAIATGMTELGVQDVQAGPSVKKSDIAESIFDAAEKNGWTK